MREPFQPMPFFEWKRSTVILVWIVSLAVVAVPAHFAGFLRGATRAGLPAVKPLTHSIYGLAREGQFSEMVTRGLTTQSLADQLHDAERLHGRVVRWRIESTVSRAMGIPFLAHVEVARTSGSFREHLVFSSPMCADGMSSEPSVGR